MSDHPEIDQPTPAEMKKPTPTDMKKSVIIDTDPGVDDFIAILLALSSPELDVLALTTTGGNVPLRHATRNALRALEAAGRADVPLAHGASRPLRGAFRYAAYFHGPTGLSIRMPLPKTRPVNSPAVEFLAALLSADSKPVTLVALGPLTNIAQLLERHPSAAQLIDRLVVMGGAIDAPGNVTPHAEFNIWNDPEAAQAVLRSGLPITLIGLDVCRRVVFTPRHVAGGAGIVESMMAGWFAAHSDRARFELCDPLAIAVAIEPALVETVPIAIEVDTSDGPERGRTRRASRGPAIDVALDVDSQRAVRLIADRVLR